ncbi:ParB/RepB/Spo0J family partition protein [Pseudomonas sp. NPDC096950]|uniref:ParB/RepB/Spo0J family partition protein n=1 Tax=Pseudomonas sp. NPDC096950 TaxID=3364485 RepID=UPI00383B9552
MTKNNHPTATHISKLRRNPLKAQIPSEKQINAMARSIEANGILDPIDVRPVRDGFEIVNGEVRWLGAKSLNIDIVPIKVLDIDDESSHLSSLMIDMTPEKMDPVDKVSGLERLVDAYGNDAVEIVLENIQGLMSQAPFDPNLQTRINALLARCGLHPLP